MLQLIFLGTQGFSTKLTADRAAHIILCGHVARSTDQVRQPVALLFCSIVSSFFFSFCKCIGSKVQKAKQFTVHDLPIDF